MIKTYMKNLTKSRETKRKKTTKVGKVTKVQEKLNERDI